MKPNPFVALNHLTVPVAIDLSRDSKVGRAEAPRRAPLSVRRVSSARIKRYETTSSADIDEASLVSENGEFKALRLSSSPLRSEPSAEAMRDLRAGLVIGLSQRRQQRRVRLGHRKRQVAFGDPPEDVIGEHTPEHGACPDAAPVIAAEGDDVVGEPMKARHRIVGHADHAVPLRLEIDRADARKYLLERPLRPGAMDRKPGSAQRADASEHEPSIAVEAEVAHDLPGVPAALASRQDGRLQIGAERRGREIEERQKNLLAPPLRPRRA